MKDATGDGAININLLPNAVREGFVVSYNATNQRWNLVGTSGDSISDSKTGPVPPGTTWTLTMGNKIRVTITQGTIPFAQSDGFFFSTFKAIAPGGKENKIGLGFFNVTGGP